MSDNRRKPDPEERKRRIVLIVVALAAALLFTFLSSFFYDSVTKKEITYNQFISLLDNGMVKEVVFDDSKIIITPHVAWATSEARQRCVDVVTENIKAFLRGEEKNVVKG